jgi:hypothetical protein
VQQSKLLGSELTAASSSNEIGQQLLGKEADQGVC